jgi:multidrug efflux pump subunit AcrA (membrane-fusion protein)
MRLTALLLSGLWLAFSAALLNAADEIKLPNCSLALDEEAQIPGQEPGVLEEICVTEGQLVAKDKLLARIDDRIPILQKKVAGYKLDVATKQAEDYVDREFAEASWKVANAEYEQALDANVRVKGAVPQAEVRRRALECEKMRLSIKKAEKDLKVNALQAQVAQGEVDAAKAMILRRQLVAPFDAIVVELTRHRGEWVQSGEPVMRLVRIDRLRVDGSVDAKNFHQADILGRPVQVTVTLPGNRRETFAGVVEYVKPMVEGGFFQVRTRINNREVQNGWAVYPGMNAEMVIKLR